MLALSNLVLAAGLVLLGSAQGFVTLALAWAALGVGMAMGLYDPAFATLRAYRAAEAISFPKMHRRSDIGLKAMQATG